MKEVVLNIWQKSKIYIFYVEDKFFLHLKCILKFGISHNIYVINVNHSMINYQKLVKLWYYLS